jgi:hypothetical protein
MKFRDVASVNLLFAALEKTYPLFLTAGSEAAVDNGGNPERDRVFHTLREFSTRFPHMPVDGNGQ